MSTAAGVERDGEEMRAALATVRDWRVAHRARLLTGPVPERAEPILPERPDGGAPSAPFPSVRVRDLEDANLLDLAVATLECALARTASIGAHWRRDATAGEGDGERTRLGDAARLGGRPSTQERLVAGRPRAVPAPVGAEGGPVAPVRASAAASASASASVSASRAVPVLARSGSAAEAHTDQEIAC